MRDRRHKGFSLIELLIVVAIILIIAAIAIPNLLRARMAANESSAVGSLREIRTANTSYYSNYPTIGYAVQLADLGGASPCTSGPNSACLIDNTLATAAPGGPGKSGYGFAAVGLAAGGLNADYVGGAVPVTSGSSGTRDFCNTAAVVFRYQPATGGGAEGACRRDRGRRRPPRHRPRSRRRAARDATPEARRRRHRLFRLER
jgi:prepilin-type N-terminal cleavage/methylation domain-containing protein